MSLKIFIDKYRNQFKAMSSSYDQPFELSKDAPIEFENDEFQRLGSVVTNLGYSDWATTDIPASIKEMWYRFSRRESDYCIECSLDGVEFKQMRIFHMHEGAGEIQFGVYACSPERSSFKATFTNMELTECKWLPHVSGV